MVIRDERVVRDRSPMRATEARLTLSIVSLRDGDIDRATDWARKAFSTDRKSVNTLSMVTDELYHEARKQFGDDPAINALNEVVTSFYTRRSGRQRRLWMSSASRS